MELSNENIIHIKKEKIEKLQKDFNYKLFR